MEDSWLHLETYFFQEVIEEHVENFDPNNPQDFIDHYLVEIQKEKNNPNTTFKDDCGFSIIDVFLK